MVILLDVLKAVLAVLLGAAVLLYVGSDYVGSNADVELAFSILGKYWAGLFCLLGHMFPCMFHFKGGKGILSGGVMAIMIDWRVALAFIIGGLVVWQHRGNIKRLIKGEERKLTFHRKKE